MTPADRYALIILTNAMHNFWKLFFLYIEVYIEVYVKKQYSGHDNDNSGKTTYVILTQQYNLYSNSTLYLFDC